MIKLWKIKIMILYFNTQELGEGKKGVGDSGYAGEPDIIVYTK